MSVQRLSSSQCIFSLIEWAILTGHSVHPHPTGCMYVYDSQVTNDQDRFELFHLTDYVVSSVSAGTIWLVAR